MKRIMSSILTACVLAALAVGCISVKKPSYRYYRLQAQSEAVAPSPKPLSVAFGPILLPGYLDRPQIVTRSGEVSLDRSDMHRWAGPLLDELKAVLLDNLSRALGTDQIAPFPWGSDRNQDVRISVIMEQLDGALGGEAILRARWGYVFAPEEKGAPAELKQARVSHLREPAGDSYESLVLAESRLLGRLAEDIAASVKRELEAKDASSPSGE